MFNGLLHALFRWFGASVIGVGVVVLGAMAPEADPLDIAFTALLLVLGPLAIARRWPKVGSWLAMALLASTPFALLMLIGVVDRSLIVSHWRCGNALMGLWLMAMPTVQALLALLAGPLWRARHRLARLWQPATIGGLLVAAGLLLPGIARYLDRGPAEEEVLIRRAMSIDLMPTLPNTTVTVEFDDLRVQRECGPVHCEVSLAPTDRPHTDPVILSGEWDVDTVLTIHRWGRWRIIEGKLQYATAPGARRAYDIDQARMTDIEVRDVAQWFGPSAGSLALLLLAVASVLGSASLRPHGPMVWRRLGALRATQSDQTEEAIALRSMHVAVLAVASLPLLASALIGLVF